MKVKLLKESEDKLSSTFLFSETSPAYANAIRRFSMDYVPTLAIEDVEFVKNTSAIYDEVIAHRLGLVPIKTDLKSYTLAKEGEEITAVNSLNMSLSAKGPKSVHSEEIMTKDPKCTPAFEKIQITKLLDEQELELTAVAIMGQGKEHAKWTPCNTFYSYDAEIKVNNASAKLKEVIEKYPPVVVFDGKIKKEAINTANLIDACDGICDDVVAIKYNDKNFKFTVESFGQLTPKEILAESTIQFNKQLDELKEVVKEIKN